MWCNRHINRTNIVTTSTKSRVIIDRKGKNLKIWLNISLPEIVKLDEKRLSTTISLGWVSCT